MSRQDTFQGWGQSYLAIRDDLQEWSAYPNPVHISCVPRIKGYYNLGAEAEFRYFQTVQGELFFLFLGGGVTFQGTICPPCELTFQLRCKGLTQFEYLATDVHINSLAYWIEVEAEGVATTSQQKCTFQFGFAARGYINCGEGLPLIK